MLLQILTGLSWKIWKLHCTFKETIFWSIHGMNWKASVVCAIVLSDTARFGLIPCNFVLQRVNSVLHYLQFSRQQRLSISVFSYTIYRNLIPESPFRWIAWTSIWWGFHLNIRSAWQPERKETSLRTCSNGIMITCLFQLDVNSSDVCSR